VKANWLACSFLCLLLISQAYGQGGTNSYNTPSITITNDLAKLEAGAENGDAKSQYQLGIWFFYGKGGLTADGTAAVKWWRKAAEQGDAEAQFFLGTCYDYGQGVEVDSAEAVKWYKRAANQGYDLAYCNLAARFFDGKGVPKNYVEAYKWYDIAAASSKDEQTVKIAANILTRLESQLLPEQIAAGQQLASEFSPHKESGSNNSISPDSPFATGTGFFITDDGYMISNNHVVKDATKVRLVTSAGLIDVKVVKVDAANDLALLKADGRFAPLPIASSRSMKLGGTVVTVGFPNTGMQGFAPKFAKGEIASLSGAEDDARYFQISVPVQPGNSGGALVDEHGNVVGVVSAKLNAAAALAASGALPENVNYAVKSSLLLSFLESVPDGINKPEATQKTTAKSQIYAVL